MGSRGRFIRVLPVLAVAVFLTVVPGASAKPLWSYVPSPFACGAGGQIVPNKTCLQGTGFNPKKSSWGAYSNPVGNCTNYVAFRLERNGASNFLKPGEGSALHWKRHAESAGKPVNRTPAVGSVAWWQPGKHGISSSGHVAYVEKVASGGKTVYLSESHFPAPEDGFAGGSRRLIVKRGEAYWPTRFLHIKDQPKKAKPKKPKSPPPSEDEFEEEEEGEEEDSTRPAARPTISRRPPGRAR